MGNNKDHRREEERKHIYSKIKNRYNTHKEAVKIPKYIIKAGIVLFFGPPIILIFVGILSAIIPELSQFKIPGDVAVWLDDVIAWSMIIGFLLVIGGRIYLDKKKQLAPAPKPNEVALLNAIEAKEKLEKYKAESIELHKVEAIKKVKKINKILSRSLQNLPYRISVMPNYNKNFQLLMEFKKNLKERLVPAIENLNEDSIDMVGDILDSMADYFYSPTTKKLLELNSKLSELEIMALPKIDYYLALVANYFSRFRVPIILILGWLIIFYGGPILGVTKDQAYIAASGFLGAGLAAYFSGLLGKK
ncbi:hypothetical protein GAH_01609 [Geoglobus ahangari]|uniref:Uncharacterized protein n=2 Tax=Geoglobus ahangari TaxID=113653 RepID=A0A0F7IDW0_9EURY|nr:hypothetical protein GAH_01609 [Geoglobus ahangari]